jgi:hypothetical protein
MNPQSLPTSAEVPPRFWRPVIIVASFHFLAAICIPCAANKYHYNSDAFGPEVTWNIVHWLWFPARPIYHILNGLNLHLSDGMLLLLPPTGVIWGITIVISVRLLKRLNRFPSIELSNHEQDHKQG